MTAVVKQPHLSGPGEVARERPRDYRSIAPMLPQGEVDARALVPGTAPLELEIGFGRGGFLIGRAAQPNVRIIGIEIKKKWAYRVKERCEKLALTNVAIFGDDARAALPRIGPDGCLERVFLHFPDPWWKKRHAARRIVDDAFLDNVARLLRVGGELFVQTDVEDRANEFLAAIRDHGAFDVPDHASNDMHAFGAHSNREVRAIADGLPVYRISARLRAR